MNIEEIATNCVDLLEPALIRNIKSFEGSTNPEILIGKDALEERRNRMIKHVSYAIHDAVVADRMTRETIFQRFVKEVADAESNPLYDNSRDDLLRDFMDNAQEILNP